MRKDILRLLGILLVVTLVVIVISGCSSPSTSAVTVTSTAVTTAAPTSVTVTSVATSTVVSTTAIKPIALRMVWEVSQRVKIPVIGMGGITKAEDAIEFILVGAAAVQIGTANLVNPKTSIEVIHGIKRYLVENNIDSIRKLTGLFLTPRL